MGACLAWACTGAWAEAEPVARTSGESPVRLRGQFGTQCVVAGVRNVRLDEGTGAWLGDFYLRNDCGVPQEVRVEVGRTSAMLEFPIMWTPGAVGDPRTLPMPSLSFKPKPEGSFRLFWSLPANGELASPGTMVSPDFIREGMDVWVLSCDLEGPRTQQAVYLSAPLDQGPEVACYNHALADGGRRPEASSPRSRRGASAAPPTTGSGVGSPGAESSSVAAGPAAEAAAQADARLRCAEAEIAVLTADFEVADLESTIEVFGNREQAREVGVDWDAAVRALPAARSRLASLKAQAAEACGQFSSLRPSAVGPPLLDAQAGQTGKCATDSRYCNCVGSERLCCEVIECGHLESGSREMEACYRTCRSLSE